MTDDKPIWLDVDGVLLDFVGSYLRLFHPDKTPEDCTKWEFQQELGEDPDTARFRLTDYRVVSMAEWYPRATETVHALSYCGVPLGFATDDMGEFSSRWAKVEVLEEAFGCGYPVAFGPGKQALRGALIDDKPENCLAFSDAGGVSVLYRRPWNREPYGGPVAGTLMDAVAACMLGLGERPGVVAKLIEDVERALEWDL